MYDFDLIKSKTNTKFRINITTRMTITVQPGGVFEAGFPQPGVWYVHARAVDRAGNWSRPAHLVYVRE